MNITCQGEVNKLLPATSSCQPTSLQASRNSSQVHLLSPWFCQVCTHDQVGRSVSIQVASSVQRQFPCSKVGTIFLEKPPSRASWLGRFLHAGMLTREGPRTRNIITYYRRSVSSWFHDAPKGSLCKWFHGRGENMTSNLLAMALSARLVFTLAQGSPQKHLRRNMTREHMAQEHCPLRSLSYPNRTSKHTC